MLNKYFVNSVDGFITLCPKSVFKGFRSTLMQLKRKILGVHPLYDNFGKAISKNDAIAHLDLDKSYKYILFFGIIREYKGLDILLEAFSDNYFIDQNIKLIVAGEFYEDAASYHALIEKYKLSKSVILAE